MTPRSRNVDAWCQPTHLMNKLKTKIRNQWNVINGIICFPEICLHPHTRVVDGFSVVAKNQHSSDVSSPIFPVGNQLTIYCFVSDNGLLQKKHLKIMRCPTATGWWWTVPTNEELVKIVNGFLKGVIAFMPCSLQQKVRTFCQSSKIFPQEFTSTTTKWKYTFLCWQIFATLCSKLNPF